MVKWMLAWEDPDTHELWLLRAIPRRWLQPGSRWEVRAIPIPHGRVGVAVAATDSELRVTLHGAVPEGTWLRLRLPAGTVVTHAEADGKELGFDHGLEAVRLPRGTGEVVVRYR
jgi:hypothetical protein